MADNDLDPLEIAKGELGATMTPTPDDLMDGLGPFAQLYYLEQLAYEVGKRFTVMILADTESGIEGDSGPAVALQAVMTAAGVLDGACIALGILPDDAAPPS